MSESPHRYWDSDKQRWVYPSDADNELLAIADFIDWLCDNCFVIAEPTGGMGVFEPISEATGAELAARFIKERKQP